MIKLIPITISFVYSNKPTQMDDLVISKIGQYLHQTIYVVKIIERRRKGLLETKIFKKVDNLYDYLKKHVSIIPLSNKNIIIRQKTDSMYYKEKIDGNILINDMIKIIEEEENNKDRHENYQNLLDVTISNYMVYYTIKINKITISDQEI